MRLHHKTVEELIKEGYQTAEEIAKEQGVLVDVIMGKRNNAGVTPKFAGNSDMPLYSPKDKEKILSPRIGENIGKRTHYNQNY